LGAATAARPGEVEPAATDCEDAALPLREAAPLVLAGLLAALRILGSALAPQAHIAQHRVDLRRDPWPALAALEGLGRDRARALARLREELGPLFPEDPVQIPGLGPGLRASLAPALRWQDGPHDADPRSDLR
jgi:hypothetical protein